jgi:predicted transcriptional regulator
MPGNAIFLSIRPKYAEKILEGMKTVELRRVRPKHVAKGALALLYVSSPVKSLVGAFRVDRVVEKPLRDLWKMVQSQAGISREEFDAYFEGVSTGVGIFFSELWLLPNPMGLQDLKEMLDFQPPQGFRYATASELAFPRFAELIEDTGTTVQVSFLSEATDNRD